MRPTSIRSQAFAARRAGAFRPPCVLLAALVAASAPSALRAQAPARTADSVLAVRQVSYWLPVGWDSSTVCAAETLFVASPADPAGFSAREVKVYLGTSGLGRGDLALRSRNAGEIRLAPVQNRRDEMFGYPEPSDLLELGSMAAEGGIWLSGRAKAAAPAWVDTVRLVLALDDDSVEVRQVRTERRAGSRTVGGVLWYEIRAEVRSSVASAARVEQHLEPGGVRAAAALEGLVRERYLYAPATGRTDSLESDGRLSGRIAYTHVSGRADTLRGTWAFRRSGSWRSSGAAEASAALEYFMVHGRHREGPSPDRFERTREALFGRELSADSLLTVRRRSTSPFARFAAEEGLAVVLGQRDTLPARVFDARPVQAHDAVFTRILLRRHRYYGADSLDLAWAQDVVGLLADEHLQREMTLDREELFETVLGTLGRAKRVAADAAPILIGAARRAADPLGRDLLLLAAYQADPAASRPLIEQLADSLEGYGPIARRYAAGDASGFFASWGVRRGRRDPSEGLPFPGLQADATSHAAYQRAGEGFSIVAVELWFAARGLDAGAEFRRRFAAASADSDRIVWAQYLMMMHDLTPLPWLRDTTVVRTAAISREVEALQRMVPEAVADEGVVVALQNLALLHATGGEVLDTLEKPIRRFSAHDERYGDWFLVSDSLEAAVLERWRNQLPVISRDSLEARAQRTGLQMGLVVSRPVRIGTRYEIEVALLPFTPRGEACLCGGGSELVFERRGGRWVVVSYSGWIS